MRREHSRRRCRAAHRERRVRVQALQYAHASRDGDQAELSQLRHSMKAPERLRLSAMQSHVCMHEHTCVDGKQGTNHSLRAGRGECVCESSDDNDDKELWSSSAASHASVSYLGVVAKCWCSRRTDPSLHSHRQQARGNTRIAGCSFLCHRAHAHASRDRTSP